MKNVLSALLLSAVLVGCSTDDEIYSANVAAVNLTANDFDIIYHNEDTSESLTAYQGIQYLQLTDWNLLVQGELDGTIYSFTGVDANTGEVEIPKTNLQFSDYQDVLLYAFGKPSGVEQQQAQINGLALNIKDLSQEDYALYVIHTYPAELGLLDIYVGDVLSQKKISEQGLAYSKATNRVKFNPLQNIVSVFESGKSVGETPMVSAAFEFYPNTVNVVFVAPKDAISNAVALYHYQVMTAQ